MACVCFYDVDKLIPSTQGATRADYIPPPVPSDVVYISSLTVFPMSLSALHAFYAFSYVTPFFLPDFEEPRRVFLC